MRKTAILLGALVLISVSCGLYAQETYIIDGFSDKYFGKIYIDPEAPDFLDESSDSPDSHLLNWVAVFDKKTKRQLIKVDAGLLVFELHDGEILANIKSLPYGEQSVVMYEDYNFDGEKDFALMDGQNSCYNGPSFQVYLADKNGFRHSKGFTRLAQEYCGMFDVDYEEKKIFTMTKDGCCRNEYSTFVVTNNTPLAVEISFEEVVDQNCRLMIWHKYGQEKRINGKLVTVSHDFLLRKRVESIERNTFYSFEFSNGKRMRLLDDGIGICYLFTDKDNNEELLLGGDQQFYYSIKDNSLRFEYEKTIYTITQKTDYTEIPDGITVTTPSKTYEMKAAPDTQQGTLSDIFKNKFKNVSIE